MEQIICVQNSCLWFYRKLVGVYLFTNRNSDLVAWHVGVFLTYGKNISHIKGNRTLVLMHSGIVDGYQLQCDAHTVLGQHRGTAAFFYFTRYRPFPLFLFMCLSLLTVLFLFLGVSIVYVSNLMRTADLVLCFCDSLTGHLSELTLGWQLDAYITF